MAEREPKCFVNLSIPREVRGEISLAKRESKSASMAEALRRATHVYRALLAAQSDGSTVEIVRADGERRRLLLL